MRREWDLDDLIASWTLVDADQELLAKLHPPSRLGFGLMVKFFEIEGRFPRHAGEVSDVAVDFVARHLGVPADAPFEVTGRAVERFRTQIREVLGFRVSTRGDEDKMIAWLAAEVCPSELNEDRQREAVLALHLLQSALVLINTRLVDRVLDGADFAGRLTANDLRGLTPLFWSNVALHGTFELDLDKRLDYDLTTTGGGADA